MKREEQRRTYNLRARTSNIVGPEVDFDPKCENPPHDMEARRGSEHYPDFRGDRKAERTWRNRVASFGASDMEC
jgi:hypothetical protein